MMGELTKEKKKRSGRESLPDLPIVHSQRKWDITKIVLRSLCLALTLADIGELVALQVSDTNFQIWIFPAYLILGPSAIWDIAEFITIGVRNNIARGIHPGAHVGVELVLWLAHIVAVIMQIEGFAWEWAGEPIWAFPVRAPYFWFIVALTQFSLLASLVFFRFSLFVRACVEVDRRRKHRRVQELVLAIQKQGWNTQSLPPPALKAAQRLDKGFRSTVLETLSASTLGDAAPSSSSSAAPPPLPPRPPGEERDFAYKYNFPIATVPELLESGIHPEDARNQKVLIGAFPRSR
ncbi:hypothetical protein F4861DRAFT_512741 [Xylaria intraflava]|nr:hypothetical protein F4861DRAFT_512741 [Xylaria intraflava]